MYPGHEWYWTTILENPDKPIPGTDTLPTPGEVAWARFATRVPHYVLSSTLSTAKWPNTTFVRSTEAGEGRPLFATGTTRHPLTLRKAQQLPDGRMSLFYEIG